MLSFWFPQNATWLDPKRADFCSSLIGYFNFYVVRRNEGVFIFGHSRVCSLAEYMASSACGKNTRGSAKLKNKSTFTHSREIGGITVDYHQNGKDKWVQATCPYCCVTDEPISIYDFDMGGHAAMKMKAHIRSSHPENSN